jgi:hypothetical protein
MLSHRTARAVVLAAVLLAACRAHAFDDQKYPDWKGQWIRTGAGNFDPAKSAGRGQEPPLIAEYQAIFEASLADQAAGGQGNNPMAACIPPGMPRMMIGYGGGMEIVILPHVTYMMMGEPMAQFRRIFTTGGSFPEKIEPTFSGYSIGHWEDSDGDGRYDTLVVETRGIKNPRSYDSSGVPFHADGKTVVKERIFLDKANQNLLRDEVTVTDTALTRPWTVMRRYLRDRKPYWMETICDEDEHQVKIGDEQYFLGGDGLLMPTRKDQPPPKLKNFDEAGN